LIKHEVKDTWSLVFENQTGTIVNESGYKGQSKEHTILISVSDEKPSEDTDIYLSLSQFEKLDFFDFVTVWAKKDDEDERNLVFFNN
jgi:hypothetical protein